MQTEEYARMHAVEDRYWWYVARRTLAVDLIQRHSPQSPRILDLGCGTGVGLAAFAELGEATGLDFSELALGFSHGRGLPRLVRGDAQRIPIADAQFDVVVSLDTIEHVADDRIALREIARVLRPGGIAVLNVPAFQWLWGPHDVALHHHRRYTRKRFAQLARDADLKIELASYSVFALFPAVVVRRMLERMKRGPAEVSLPQVPEWANRALIRLMAWEGRLLRSLPLPWGSSVVLVARKRM